MKRAHTKAMIAAVLVSAAAACAPPDAGRASWVTDEYLRILAAEDARPSSGPELQRLIRAAGAGPVLVRRAAVRALGRLENPALAPEIESLLDDPVAGVRAEAANALAQSVHAAEGDAVVPALIAREAVEHDPGVRGVLARSIGRSAESDETRARAMSVLVGMSREEGADAPVETLVGVALGMESLVRRAGGAGISARAATRLEELMGYGEAGRPHPDAARVRALAVSTLGQSGRLDASSVERARNDADPGVRLAAARWVGAVAPANRPELIRRLLRDPDTAVALEGFRALVREPVAELYCRYLLAGVDPRVPASIRITALGGLGRPCPKAAEQRDEVVATVAEIDTASVASWHAPAHALLALTALAPDEASGWIDRFARHESPFARAHAARAAAALADAATLRALVDDPDANVRTAALEGLFALEGHAIDDLLLAEADDDDPQLLMTVAGLLEGSPRGLDAARRLMDAFERISAAERETWRDPRRALLVRIAELGAASLAGRLRPYLADYDALVADDVAGMLSAWTGTAHAAVPKPLPREPLPTERELEALDGARVALHMRAGGTIVIELMPWLATANVHRFTRLAEQGYYDGLTFHRWAPNFVVQGGSPGANEYQGAGAYSRDEVGLQPHWRGTVGISTRGRDTGDAQIFVNLVDNVRLNHDYTIIGTVVEGMEVVDAVLEGSSIERAEVVRAR